jgi:heat-inducible transcriptional repressor
VAGLSARARQILYAAVSEFVQTGEPVGSRTLATRGIELSPATIRSVLADLEDAGFLHQPHTSAGRVPTDLAFRLFIDALMELREPTHDEQSLIRMRFEEMEPGPFVLRDAGRLLSELTGSAALVISPRTETLKLRHLRFIRTTPGEFLAVLVMADGSVQNRFLRTTLDDADLDRVHNLLDEAIEERTLGDLRDFFARRKNQNVSDGLGGLRRTAFELGEAAVGPAVRAGADLVIEGRSKLLEQAQFVGAEDLRTVVSALDDETRILRLLDATLEANGTAVLVGRELADLGNGQLSVIGATYKRPGQSPGAVAVIGPTRMDYAKVVPLVTATASAMTTLLQERPSQGSLPSSGDDD